MKKLLCILMCLCLLTVYPVSLAETSPQPPLAIVLYDSSALPYWSPRYSPELPGTLLELTQPEGILTVTALESELSPAESLSEQLDLAGEMLVVADAQIAAWEGSVGTNGHCLTYSYTYPEGDETHQCQLISVRMEDYLVQITMDCWDENAVDSLSALVSAFVEGGFSLRFLSQYSEVQGTIGDITATDAGGIQLELNVEGALFTYPLATDAVVLFSGLDDPYLQEPVQPTMDALVDAILTHEEGSDSPALFRVLLHDGQIVYMQG